jgi:hypothetical protein
MLGMAGSLIGSTDGKSSDASDGGVNAKLTPSTGGIEGGCGNLIGSTDGKSSDANASDGDGNPHGIRSL